jgi:hypothetical protein
MAQVLTRSEVANKIIAGLQAILRTKIQYYDVFIYPEYVAIEITLPKGYVYNLSGKGRTLILEIRTLGHDPIGKIDVTLPFGRELLFYVQISSVMAEVFKWTVETREKEYYLIIEEELGTAFVTLSDVPYPKPS